MQEGETCPNGCARAIEMLKSVEDLSEHCDDVEKFKRGFELLRKAIPMLRTKLNS